MTTRTIENVAVMKVGTWNGHEVTLAALHEAQRGFDAEGLAGKLPVKLGHGAPDTAEAAGWIAAMRVKGDTLYADIADVPEALVADVRAGRWRFVSMEFLTNAVTSSGRKWGWLPDGLALLGSARPAVDTLPPLTAYLSRSMRGLRFEQRLAFTRANDDEAEALRAEVRRLNEQLLRQAQDTDVATGRVVAAERVRFDRRYRDAPDGRTVESWKLWVADCPPVKFRRGESPPGRAVDSDDTLRPDSRPDVELMHLAEAEVEKSGGRLTFSQASIKVMRDNPELAERYRYMPGVKDS